MDLIGPTRPTEVGSAQASRHRRRRRDDPRRRVRQLPSGCVPDAHRGLGDCASGRHRRLPRCRVRLRRLGTSVPERGDLLPRMGLRGGPVARPGAGLHSGPRGALLRDGAEAPVQGDTIDPTRLPAPGGAGVHEEGPVGSASKAVRQTTRSSRPTRRTRSRHSGLPQGPRPPSIASAWPRSS